MSVISQRYVKLVSLLLLALLVGIVVTHPHGAHSHETEAATGQHSHSHPQHETPDEPDHSDFTTRLSSTSFVLGFAALGVVSTISISDSISVTSVPQVLTEFTKQSAPLQSLTRVYLL